jgi:phenylpyruvate tautomerase
MPFLHVQTNQSTPNGAQLLSRVSSLAAKALSKPESYVMTRLSVDTAMTFGGNTEPCAMVSVSLVGSASAAARSTLARELCALLESDAGVAQGRVFVQFSEYSGSHWGMGGNLFG